MNLVASLIVKDELDRYLLACVESLLGFCDEIRVWDDGSTDGTRDVLSDLDRVKVAGTGDSRFFGHEGRARQAALEWTIDAHPTHVLSIDADEIVGDGAMVRAMLESDPREPAWSLCMGEVWKADADELMLRQDGGWRAHTVTVVWQPGRDRRIPDRALASGRVPSSVARARARFAGCPILHFGWAREAERVRRHERYAIHDQGNFHAGSHLDSILWPDERVTLERCPWPAGIVGTLRGQILDTVRRP